MTQACLLSWRHRDPRPPVNPKPLPDPAAPWVHTGFWRRGQLHSTIHGAVGLPEETGPSTSSDHYCAPRCPHPHVTDTDTRNTACTCLSVIRLCKVGVAEPCVASQGSLQALLALTPGSAHHPSTHEPGEKCRLGGWLCSAHLTPHLCVPVILVQILFWVWGACLFPPRAPSCHCVFLSKRVPVLPPMSVCSQLDAFPIPGAFQSPLHPTLDPSRREPQTQEPLKSSLSSTPGQVPTHPPWARISRFYSGK